MYACIFNGTLWCRCPWIFGQAQAIFETKVQLLEQGQLVHAHRISLYEELEKLGMGIKELKLLRYTVAEIVLQITFLKIKQYSNFSLI